MDNKTIEKPLGYDTTLVKTVTLGSQRRDLTDVWQVGRSHFFRVNARKPGLEMPGESHWCHQWCNSSGMCHSLVKIVKKLHLMQISEFVTVVTLELLMDYHGIGDCESVTRKSNLAENCSVSSPFLVTVGLNLRILVHSCHSYYMLL